jgi:hypothetical protein
MLNKGESGAGLSITDFAASEIGIGISSSLKAK